MYFQAVELEDAADADLAYLMQVEQFESLLDVHMALAAVPSMKGGNRGIYAGRSRPAACSCFIYSLDVTQLAVALDGAMPKRCLKMREKCVGFSKPKQ